MSKAVGKKFTKSGAPINKTVVVAPNPSCMIPRGHTSDGVPMRSHVVYLRWSAPHHLPAKDKSYGEEESQEEGCQAQACEEEGRQEEGHQEEACQEEEGS
jgi:hypothetical protein